MNNKKKKTKEEPNPHHGGTGVKTKDGQPMGSYPTCIPSGLPIRRVDLSHLSSKIVIEDTKYVCASLRVVWRGPSVPPSAVRMVCKKGVLEDQQWLPAARQQCTPKTSADALYGGDVREGGREHMRMRP
ncbi:hypothetical protein QE152_g1051 [Popillia japonica]|uniref:Uncharacterized protein n=1 Tax=Popillia japonica TaxID=7064 RepID=A0AAW1N3N6_POPJA